MKLLGIDLETTGLDTQKDEVTEIGYVLVDTEVSKPLLCVSDLVDSGVDVPDEITEITHITTDMLREYGRSPSDVLSRLVSYMNEVDYIVAHNGNFFDKPFLYRWSCDHEVEIPDKPWLDTRDDVPYPKHYRYRNLTYLAAEHGFINPFPHAALFDAMAMMKVLSHYDINEVIKRFKTPWVVIRADVSFERKDEAKKLGYQWQKAGDKTYTKCWVKRVKEFELEQERQEATFKVIELRSNDDT